MPFAQVDGARLYWKRDGLTSAPTLVLLNSIGTDMDLWDPMLPILREHYALLRIDTRGHGASLAQPGDFSMAMLAKDVLAIADVAGFARFAVAGVSLGGMIGMELALQAPERIGSLALICTSATMDSRAWSDRVKLVRERGMEAIADLAMGRFLSASYRTNHPGNFEAVRRQLVDMEPDGYASCGAAIRDMDLAERISAIHCPTLIVTGTHDTSTPLERHGEHLLARIAGATHRSLDAAHLAPLEAPDALADALITFLGADS